jgi:hypothetical protein
LKISSQHAWLLFITSDVISSEQPSSLSLSHYSGFFLSQHLSFSNLFTLSVVCFPSPISRQTPLSGITDMTHQA